jgi:Na+/H+ antiporter NhaD/arsenite permease-like protein
LRYATLGVLFVNISIGGTLTNFAAPPVLMVAAKWEWDTTFMLVNFGWKSAVAVFINAVAVTWLFRTELNTLKIDESQQVSGGVPLTVTGVHLLFLVGVIFFAHHPVVFVGLLLFFIGYTEAYKAHQDRLILREALLVAFFLAGLVILGGLQAWWLQPALVGVEPSVLFFIATGLTAITDNAALTYLASLVEGTSPEFRYAITAGAVTGGGLTVIANAPNPAGLAILKDGFHDQAVSPLKLLFAAALPTAVAAVALLGL